MNHIEPILSAVDEKRGPGSPPPPPPPPPQDRAHRRSASPSYVLTGYRRTPGSDVRGRGRLTPTTPGAESPAPPSRTLTDELDPPTLHPDRSIPVPLRLPTSLDPNHWITVYGFRPSEAGTVLEDFRRCGEILHYGFFGQEGGNFIHFQYASREAAQRALARDGEHLRPNLMVGVRPIRQDDKRRVLHYVASHPQAPSPLEGGVYDPTGELDEEDDDDDDEEEGVPGRHEGRRGSRSWPVPARTWWGAFQEYVLGV